MNIVVLQGNLATEPEIRNIESNSKSTHVANFVLAVTRFYKRSDGQKDKEVIYIACEAWDTGAETIGKYVHKGDPLLINGSLKVENWEKEGVRHSRTKVRVANFKRLYRAPPREEQEEAVGVAATADTFDNAER